MHHREIKRIFKNPRFPYIQILKTILLKNLQFKEQITVEIIRYRELN